MSEVSPQTAATASSPWAITTERLVIAGVLAAITIILGVVPGIGFFPVPNTTGNATTEHIPTILGGVIGGPIVGIFSGLVFGLVSFLRATSPLFKDPLVAIVPRLFIGLVAWAVFAGLVRIRLNRDAAALIAGVFGSATNTVLVLSMAILRGYIQPVVVLAVLPQAIAEAIAAAIITVVLARVFYILQKRYIRAPETKSREELPY